MADIVDLDLLLRPFHLTPIRTAYPTSPAQEQRSGGPLK
jgi:hypothetical protein